MKEYLTIDSNDSNQTRFKVSETSKIDNLIREKRFDEALSEIDNLISHDNNPSYLNLKGIALSGLKRYEESVACFDKALKNNTNDEYQLNKSQSLYEWAKITFFPEGDYEKALNLINDALSCIPGNEDASEYYFLKAEILEGMGDLVESQKAYLTAYKEFGKLEEFESQVDYLKTTNDTLINIVGSEFYSFKPEKGIILKLVKDIDNEHDPDAIAVMNDNETVGYVANNPYTLIDEVKSASMIKNQIADNQKVEIVFIYLGEYVIAKLL